MPNQVLRAGPILIGALGGSGTRVFARLAEHAGVFIGSRRNHAEDSEPIMDFYATWLRRYLLGHGELPFPERADAEADFSRCLSEHLTGYSDPNQQWCVKVPRNILMLRFWHNRFPTCRFVHVVRNGLDMACSTDRNQLNMIGDLVLSEAEQRLPPSLRAIAYWRRVNVAAADFAGRHLGRRYLRVRFEDLCDEPSRVTTELLNFLGVPSNETLVSKTAAVIERPASIGRWRSLHRDQVDALRSAGREALQRFGYWDDES